MEFLILSKGTRLFGLPAEQGRWIFIGLGIIINLCLGSVYSWSIFRKPLEEMFEIGSTQSGLPFMVFLIFFAGLMPFAGRFIDKYGPRLVTLVGGVLFGLGWILSSFAGNILILTITYGVIAGSGVGIAYGGPIAVATKWFPKKRGLAVGLTIIGFGLSPLITAPLAKYFINSFDPLKAFGLLGIIFLILLVTLSIPLKFPSVQSTSDKSDKKYCFSNPNETKDFNALEMVKTLSFYGIWICYIIGTLTGLMAIGISSPVGEEIIKLDSQKAALFVSLFAVFNGLGRPVFGWLTDKINSRFAAITSFIIIILASVGMLNAKEASSILFVLCFSGFWFSFGGWLAIAPATTSRFFGVKYYSMNYGIVYSAYGAGALVGNLMAGRIRDIFGSYLFTFYPTLILAIMGVSVAWFMVRSPKTNQSE
ncbi:OFA family MFS transporter, partial [Candidatus Dependentiae bacterium]|nr:OFA family MFS transporter [Candidatus Dependentiae bacterium]